MRVAFFDGLIIKGKNYIMAIRGYDIKKTP